MIGAGTIINPILKIVTTVVILGAIYLFFVRPILDTTEEVARQGTSAFQQSQRNSDKAFQDATYNSALSRADSYASSLLNTWPAGSRELKDCIRDAKGNTSAMERCADYGQKIVHTLQSDYNFANSYADSLALQGDSAGAAKVRVCVDKAGFKAGAMQRCRDLADKLLFG